MLVTLAVWPPLLAPVVNGDWLGPFHGIRDLQFWIHLTGKRSIVTAGNGGEWGRVKGGALTPLTCPVPCAGFGVPYRKCAPECSANMADTGVVLMR